MSNRRMTIAILPSSVRLWLEIKSWLEGQDLNWTTLSLIVKQPSMHIL